MSNPIVHAEVVGEDAEVLQAFYRDAFDWQMLPSGPDYAMAHPGVEGGIDGGVGASPHGRTHIADHHASVAGSCPGPARDDCRPSQERAAARV